MEIYTAIQKASPKAREGILQRLALATSLEHAVPIKQSNAQDQTNAPTIVDPVKRYLHYEKAYLDGELDPAFKNFTAWEYRMVVDCDAPDEILAWGREMLRNYRPDHIYNPDYGWRYVGNRQDRSPLRFTKRASMTCPSLHNYQNIIKNGGVCGRRAFFGRFILQQFRHPDLGRDPEGACRLESLDAERLGGQSRRGLSSTVGGTRTRLRAAGRTSCWRPRRGHMRQDYLKVLRAQWISRVLGEQAYNDRKGVAGGFLERHGSLPNGGARVHGGCVRPARPGTGRSE